MSDENVRDVLLKQNGHTPVENELKALSGLMESEDRRVRRLTRWTIGVWIAWLATWLLFPAYMMASRSGPDVPPPATMSTTMPAHHAGPGILGTIVGAIIILSLVGFFGLPIIGIVLLIMTLLARRSANLNRIRVSLATIESQLKILAGSRQAEGPPRGEA